MKLKPFSEISQQISLDSKKELKRKLAKQEKDLAKSLEERAERVKAQAVAEIVALDMEIDTNQANISLAMTAPDIRLSLIIDAMDAIELLGRRKGQYQQILAEMFPDAPDAVVGVVGAAQPIVEEEDHDPEPMMMGSHRDPL